MKYYPKNRIKTDLYTRGKDYKNSQTKQPYTGYYYKLYNGKAFTGKKPGDYPNTPLIPIVKEETSLNKHIKYNKQSPKVLNYLEQKGIDPNSTKIIPKQYILTASNIDYEKEYLVRYFLKHINEETYLEVNEDTYNNISEENEEWDWERYIPFKIIWYIKGHPHNIERKNRKKVEDIIRIWGFKKFKLYLNENYVKYLKN